MPAHSFWEFCLPTYSVAPGHQETGSLASLLSGPHAGIGAPATPLWSPDHQAEQPPRLSVMLLLIRHH